MGRGWLKRLWPSPGPHEPPQQALQPQHHYLEPDVEAPATAGLAAEAVNTFAHSHAAQAPSNAVISATESAPEQQSHVLVPESNMYGETFIVIPLDGEEGALKQGSQVTTAGTAAELSKRSSESFTAPPGPHSNTASAFSALLQQQHAWASAAPALERVSSDIIPAGTAVWLFAHSSASLTAAPGAQSSTASAIGPPAALQPACPSDFAAPALERGSSEMILLGSASAPNKPQLHHDSAESLHDLRHMSTASRGMHVTFQDVSYIVKDRAGRRSKLAILQGVSGYFNPGEMAAIMGPSGSGKSTILDLLAGRKTVGEQRGDILFSGGRPTQGFLKRYTGYVEQLDTLIPELTVREMLLYTAELKCPRSEPLCQKRHRVDQLLETLALTRCARTVIGNAMTRGISGGQAKRTNIGIALITKPQVLFLDEPTSGLDSYTAHEVMTVVQGLVKQGITICATIHCPPPHTFTLFDRVLIMQRGRVAYFGANGQPAISYFYDHFEKVRRKCANENLAEWIVDITTEADRQGSDVFIDMYRQSKLKQQNDMDGALHIAASVDNLSKADLKALSSKSGTATPMWLGLWVMLKYRTRNNYCSRHYLFARIFDKFCFSFATATFFLAVGSTSSAANVTNIAGLLYMWVNLPAYGAGPYLPAVVMERATFVREMSDGLYSPLTYLLYKMTEELFMALLMSVGFAVPVFYLCQMQGSFIVFWLAWLISLSDGIAFAYAAAAVSPTIDISNCVLLTYPTVLMFAGGFILRWADIPRYWQWLSYINWLWYGWGAAMINQYKSADVKVSGSQTVLEYYSLDGIDEWAFLGYSALTFVFFFSVAYLALFFLKHHKR